MPAPEPKLRVRALRHLARREYTRQELARVLALHAENEAEVETVLDEFSQRGWLSETRAAEQLVHARRGRYGPVRIRRDLEAKGVSAEVIGNTVASLKAGEFEAALRSATFQAHAMRRDIQVAAGGGDYGLPVNSDPRRMR